MQVLRFFPGEFFFGNLPFIFPKIWLPERSFSCLGQPLISSTVTHLIRDVKKLADREISIKLFISFLLIRPPLRTDIWEELRTQFHLVKVKCVCFDDIGTKWVCHVNYTVPGPNMLNKWLKSINLGQNVWTCKTNRLKATLKYLRFSDKATFPVQISPVWNGRTASWYTSKVAKSCCQNDHNIQLQFFTNTDFVVGIGWLLKEQSKFKAIVMFKLLLINIPPEY